jgi:hypothetical protein
MVEVLPGVLLQMQLNLQFVTPKELHLVRRSCMLLFLFPATLVAN